MTDDRRTKAQLLAELQSSEDRRISEKITSEKLQAALEVAQAKPTTSSKEALALGACINWLDDLTVKGNGFNGSGYGGTHPDTSSIGRILKHLAARFDIALIDVQVRDCARKHVDEINQYALQQAIQTAVQS